MTKKKKLSYFLAMAFVLVITVLLFQPASAQVPYTLTINIVPTTGGTVNVDGEPYTAPIAVTSNQHVTLAAIPDTAAGYTFSSWDDSLGVVSGDSLSTDFFVIGDHVITATFTPPPTCYALIATANPSAAGMVTYPPGNPSCQEQGQLPGQYYVAGTPISLTATTNDGYQFDNWTGNIGTANPQQSSIEITMDQPRTVTANFSPACRELILLRNNVTTASTDPGGTIPAANPTKGSCPNNHEFRLGESTTLTAIPETGWKITSWTIGTSNFPPSGNTLLVTMPPLPSETGLAAQVNYGEKATFGFTAPSQTVPEPAGTVQIEVTRDTNTLPDPAQATIQYRTVDGSAKAGQDYTGTNGYLPLTFGTGITSRTITIDIENDDFNEGQESFYVELSNSNNDIKLGMSTIEVQILDDEGDPTIKFEPSSYTADESTTSVTVTVTVFPLPASGDVYVDLDTQDVTATAGEDYTAISERPLRIRTSRGQTSTTTTISLTPDDLDELDEETLLLQLVNPSNNAVIAADSDAVLIIVDDDLPPSVAFSQSEYYIKKAGNTEALIPVNLSAPSGREVEVYYKVTHEQSGNVQEDTLSFPAGSQTQTLHIPITSANPEDVFTLQLSDPLNVALGTPDAANLFILSTDTSDCHDLTLTFDGFGLAPAATSKAGSPGCPGGQYVAGEFIDIVARPQHGWYVSGWQGTINDESTSMQNVVEMPNNALTVSARYRVPIFFSIVNYEQPSFVSPNEEEPNNLFSNANGPIVLDRDYRGTFSSDTDINDLFYFELEQETNVSITLKDIPNGRDYDLALYDESWVDGKALAISNLSGNANEEMTKTLSPGKYFIQVYSGASEPSTASYRLRAEAN